VQSLGSEEGLVGSRAWEGRGVCVPLEREDSVILDQLLFF
jgi:hypothetical protein